MLNLPRALLELDSPFIDDLQNYSGLLNDVEQNRLRLMLALRALRVAAGRPNLSPEDLTVVEVLLVRWWASWSKAEGPVPTQYGVRITVDAIAGVCGVALDQAAASLARLVEAELIELPVHDNDPDEEDGPVVSLVGIFRAVLSAAEPLLLRDLIERHKEALRLMARDYLDVLMEDVDFLEENRAGQPGATDLLRDWNFFTSGPRFESVMTGWDHAPAAAYAWLDKLAELQERVELINSYPSSIGSLRKELAELQEVRIAVLSDRYAKTPNGPRR